MLAEGQISTYLDDLWLHGPVDEQGIHIVELQALEGFTHSALNQLWGMMIIVQFGVDEHILTLDAIAEGLSKGHTTGILIACTMSLS